LPIHRDRFSAGEIEALDGIPAADRLERHRGQIMKNMPGIAKTVTPDSDQPNAKWPLVHLIPPDS
jgi:hypothetical protein